MFYTIYKIINQINGKIYIGKHQTEDLNDIYMGSGKCVRLAIEKYGIENFKKEILFIFDNESDMNSKEAEIVTEDFIKKDSNYNLCPGGHGGFGYLNSIYWTEQKRLEHNRKVSPFGSTGFIEKYKSDMIAGSKKGSLILSNLVKEGKIDPRTFLGKTHSDETRRKMSIKAKERLKDPKNNSQYGTRWVYSLEEKKSMKIKKDDPLPKGWNEGRKIKFD